MVLKLPEFGFLDDGSTIGDRPSFQAFDIGVGSCLPFDFLIEIDGWSARLSAHWLRQTFLIFQNSPLFLFDLVGLTDILPFLFQADWLFDFGLLFLFTDNFGSVGLKVQVIWEFYGRFFQASSHSCRLDFLFLVSLIWFLFNLDCILMWQHVNRFFSEIVLLLWQFIVAAWAGTLFIYTLKSLKLLLITTVNDLIDALLLGAW